MSHCRKHHHGCTDDVGASPAHFQPRQSASGRLGSAASGPAQSKQLTNSQPVSGPADREREAGSLAHAGASIVRNGLRCALLRRRTILRPYSIACVEPPTIMKGHSHPGGYAACSMTMTGRRIAIADDAGMARCRRAARQRRDVPGRLDLWARLERDPRRSDRLRISVSGEDLHFWYRTSSAVELANFVGSHDQAFEKGHDRTLASAVSCRHLCVRGGRPGH